MSLEIPTNPVYHTSVEQKLHSKNAAKIYRYGSPKIRDQLRDKCRMRVREARQANFSKRRLTNITEEFDIDKLLREELASLESDLRLQEEIYKELRDEMNEWFVQELEAEEISLIKAADEDENNNHVICPICEQYNLLFVTANEQEGSNIFKCTCGVSFNNDAKPLALRQVLHSQIDVHEQNCTANLTFFLEPQSAYGAKTDACVNSLCAMCDECDYFYSF
ncbi:RIP-like protein [Zeugodacus cucurbitae]|uniref:RIP-like protein n=1 Tax=Zeugodacus cucurbitae TaxID=28588 RepID=UPI0023D90D1D|nr:RIP-like protein [Zeugodacus cucurbitae]XP_054083675.1 RIP-like protein [Zeugodacus cucurbitae]